MNATNRLLANNPQTGAVAAALRNRKGDPIVSNRVASYRVAKVIKNDPVGGSGLQFRKVLLEIIHGDNRAPKHPRCPADDHPASADE